MVEVRGHQLPATNGGPKLNLPDGYTAIIHHLRLTRLDAEMMRENGERLKEREDAVLPVNMHRVLRKVEEIKRMGWEVSSHGGYTYAMILKDGEEVARGETWCSPFDPFNRKIGRDIALGRALTQVVVYSA